MSGNTVAKIHSSWSNRLADMEYQPRVRHRATEHEQVFSLAFWVVAWPGFRACERRHSHEDQDSGAQSDNRSDQYHHDGSLGHRPRMPSSQETVQTSGQGRTAREGPTKLDRHV